MARTVEDATLLLSALAGAAYGRALDRNGLRGARIGVARQIFGFNDHVDRLMETALALLKQQGAVLIDPATIPTYSKLNEPENEALQWEFKEDLNAYLAARGGSVKSLKDVIEFNNKNRDREMPYFAQDIMVKAEAKGPLSSRAYRDLVSKLGHLVRQDGLDKTLNDLKLDALVAPSDGPAWPTDYVNGDHFSGSASTPAAIAGYPHVTVPAGFVFGLPVGISFFGAPRSEVKLIRMAYAYEQATMLRKPPQYLPTVKI
jgi:amidase